MARVVALAHGETEPPENERISKLGRKGSQVGAEVPGGADTKRGELLKGKEVVGCGKKWITKLSSMKCRSSGR